MTRDDALTALLRRLADIGYAFTTPTPATHARVIGRRPEARDLRDVLGWSQPFRPGLLGEELEALLAAADALEPLADGSGLRRAKVRVSRLEGRLYLHSAYPTREKDAVFFGPDSYRFARFVLAGVADFLDGAGAERAAAVLDIGAGAGVGGLTAADRLGRARITLTDVNAEALRLAEANARAAGIPVRTCLGELPPPDAGTFDLVLANPPYLVDARARTYRDGGGEVGEAVSLAMARGGLGRLRPGGRMLLYSGAAIVEGRDALLEGLRGVCAAAGADLAYEEIDPDVFGEELERPAYRVVERIAAVGATITLR